MPDPTTIVLFAAAGLALLLLPGPVVLYTVARSMHQGRKAGVVSALAAGLGDFCHVVAAALGLSALLMSSALAFNAVKLAGAAYLLFIGLRTLLRDREDHEVRVENQPLRQIFWQGLIVAVLNPKTGLFFLAFLPQFIHPENGPVVTQILVLGIIYVLMGMVTNNGYAAIAATAGQWMRGNRRFARRQRFVAGGVYLALGLTTALAGSESTT